jgi:hypothetical protein
MSIRSRIATFEARNEELRKTTEPYLSVGGKQPPSHTSAASVASTTPSSPEDAFLATAENNMTRMATTGSVAGRFGATKPASYVSKSKPATRIQQQQPHQQQQQRYQPLHQQYQMRQQQRQQEANEEHYQANADNEPAPPVAKTSRLRDNVSKRSPHRRAAHYRTRLDQMKGVEDNQRRLHESQQVQDQQQRQQQSSMEKGTTHSESTVAYRTSKTTTAQRLVKMQRMKQARMRNETQQRLSEKQRSSPEPLPGDLSLQNSATADDEITLTSVRQIVGNAAETTVPAESVPMDESAHVGDNPRYNNQYHHHVHSQPDEMTYNHDDYDWPEEKSDKDRDVWRSTDGGRGGYHGNGINNDASRHVTGSHSMQQAPAYYEDSRLIYPNSSPQYDELSQGSESFAQRKERERLEQEAREKAVEQAKAEMQGPFLKAEDVEHYQKSIDTPIVKTAAGVAVAATLGCVMLGPMGLLVGAAAVGLGFGVMQIPAEQRRNLEEKATHTLNQVSETAIQASESMSNSCVNTYRNSGFAEHVPAEVNNCCGAISEAPTAVEKSDIVTNHSMGGDMEIKDPIDVPGGTDIERSNTEEIPKKLPPKRAGAACLRAGKFKTACVCQIEQTKQLIYHMHFLLLFISQVPIHRST